MAWHAIENGILKNLKKYANMEKNHVSRKRHLKFETHKWNEYIYLFLCS